MYVTLKPVLKRCSDLQWGTRVLRTARSGIDCAARSAQMIHLAIFVGPFSWMGGEFEGARVRWLIARRAIYLG